jgi:hypothetical protein
MRILDIETKELIKVDILLATSSELPLKKDGWNFHWRQLLKKHNAQTFILKIKEDSSSIEGMLQLIRLNDMLIMDVIEIAPHNVGNKNKKYDYVAGCLIAYACRESFKIEGNYKGFLTFTSKTDLIEWYINQYGATQAIGQKMFISPKIGTMLIDKYLNTEK